METNRKWNSRSFRNHFERASQGCDHGTLAADRMTELSIFIRILSTNPRLS